MRLVLALLLVSACRTPEDIAKQSQGSSDDELGTLVGGCREQWTPMTPNLEDKLGFTAQEVLTVTAGTHEILLTWIGEDIEPTRLVLGVSRPKPYYVQSKSTNDPATAAGACTNHMVLESTVSLQTRDGFLDENIQKVPIVAFGHSESHGTFRIKATDLHGEYVPQLEGVECLRELVVRVLFGNDSIHGTIADIVTNGTCEAPTGTPPEERLSARWGLRYLHY